MPDRGLRRLVCATSRRRWPRLAVAVAGFAGLVAAPAMGAVVPHLGDEGLAEFAQYGAAAAHKAFAIAPGGAWGWSAAETSRQGAEQAALAACRQNTPLPCVLYESDGQRVFDAQAWPSLLSPYASAADARRAVVGTGRGERFPTLAFRDASGAGRDLARYRGEVVVLHFWGSWCGPCQRELPDLQALHAKLRGTPHIVFVLLQVSEPADVARRWMAARGIRLPMYDSGERGVGDDSIALADGGRIGNRDIAPVFPTTYVLDRRGLVLMSHVGAVPRWSEYEDFLRDAALKSGR